MQLLCHSLAVVCSISTHTARPVFQKHPVSLSESHQSLDHASRVKFCLLLYGVLARGIRHHTRFHLTAYSSSTQQFAAEAAAPSYTEQICYEEEGKEKMRRCHVFAGRQRVPWWLYTNNSDRSGVDNGPSERIRPLHWPNRMCCFRRKQALLLHRTTRCMCGRC